MSRGVNIDLVGADAVKQGAVLPLSARLWARKPSTVVDPDTFAMTDDPGETINLANIGFRATFRASVGAPAAELTLTNVHFQVVGAPPVQTIVGRAPATLTAAMTAPAGVYDWEAYDLTNPDEVIEIQFGEYELGREVTT